MVRFRHMLLAGMAALCFANAAQAQKGANADQQQLGRNRVLLISVDGMHDVDLRLWVKAHPAGALARLAARGTTYSNAFATAPSDSFPGMVAQVTGGTPFSTGVFYDNSYDRTLFAPGSNCAGAPGSQVEFAENIDKDPSLATGGGTLGQPLTQIDPAKLPLASTDAGCVPVYPHQFIRVNTLFEVVRAHGGHTAWSDKHPAYDILNGPSGSGVEDLFTPEINSLIPGGPAGRDNTTSFAAVRAYDQTRVNAVINQIDGLDSTGGSAQSVPNVFGMNFQSVSVGQKLARAGFNDPAELTGGYLDADGTPGNALTLQLDFVDGAIGRMVDELRSRDLYDRTVIIVSAKHGQSPIDLKQRRALPDTYASVVKHGYAFNNADDVALVWLDPATQKETYNQALADIQAARTELGIDRVLARPQLVRSYRDPFSDSRTPDFFVVTQQGVIYTGGTKLAEHGGIADDDRHVAMLVSAPGLEGDKVDEKVFTTQIAPTILRALGLRPAELQAVRIEHTKVLPGLF